MRRTSGFTLIELCIVMAIVILLASFGTVYYKRAQWKSKQIACEYNLTKIYSEWTLKQWEHTTPTVEEVTEWMKGKDYSYCPNHFIRYKYNGTYDKEGALVTFYCQDKEHSKQEGVTAVSYKGNNKPAETWAGKIDLQYGFLVRYRCIVAKTGKLGWLSFPLQAGTATPEQRLMLMKLSGANPKYNPEMTKEVKK